MFNKLTTDQVFGTNPETVFLYKIHVIIILVLVEKDGEIVFMYVRHMYITSLLKIIKKVLMLRKSMIKKIN